MKKILKLLTIMTLVLALGVSAFACTPKTDDSTPGNKLDGSIDLGGKDADNDANTIEVYLYSAGYGVEWFNACAREFMRLYPEYKIVASEASSNTTLRKKLSSGPKFTADLIIVGDNINAILAEGSSVYQGYPVIFENLDDVYNSVPLSDDGDVTFLNKINAEVAERSKQTVTINKKKETHYYTTPWTDGYAGLFYNVDLFQQAGLTSEPRTTQELLDYCAQLKQHSISPIIMSSADDYIQYLSWVWWAQYEGQEGIENFYYCRENSDALPSADVRVFEQEGYKEIFRIYEELLGSNTNDFCESFSYTEAQRYFLKGDKNRVEHGAIMPNGNWLENEMVSSSTTETVRNISMMQTPVTSALIDKLSVWTESAGYRAANLTADKKADYDNKLRAIIDYVDGAAAKPDWATDADVATVRKARNYYFGGNGSTMSVPAFATAKEGAKKFISFMGSDTAIDLYFRSTNGCTLPFDYDYESNSYYAEISDLAKKSMALKKGKTTVIDETAYVTYYKGGFRYDAGINGHNFAITFGSYDAASRYTAEQVFTNIKKVYNTATLQVMLRNCGLML